MTMIPVDPQPGPEIPVDPPVNLPGAITGPALQRLEGDASRQLEANTAQLAMTPYEYGRDPGGINAAVSATGAQAQHPSARRLDAAQWDGKTSQLNHAQAAAPGAPVWVTVPVDKVTTSGGASSITPVYASTKGYIPRPGESAGSVPPGHAVGRPY